jgi:hypothetical protein
MSMMREKNRKEEGERERERVTGKKQQLLKGWS